MDNGYDLLMNPQKSNSTKYHKLSKFSIHDAVKEHIIQNTNLLHQPLTLESLDEIISITLDLKDKPKIKVPISPPVYPTPSYTQPMFPPSGPCIPTPVTSESRKINFTPKKSKFDLTKLF